MIVALACVAAVVAAIVQRITGLAFVLILLGPVVLVYGPVEGVTIAVLLSVVASAFALPSAWRDIDWRRTLWLLAAGVIAAPFGALVTRMLPEAALLFLIGGMAVLALSWSRLGPAVSGMLRGRRGAVAAGAVGGFMHSSSGLSGPALAAYAIGDDWEQRRFAASAQVIFFVFGLMSVSLRGLPHTPMPEIVLLAACTAGGIIIGAVSVRWVPTRIARIVMLCSAWAGAIVVLVRGVVSVVG